MASRPSISAAEWEVMCVLWAQSPLMAGQVVERLALRKSWNPRTIKTLLNRLIKKGAVGFSPQGNRYLYRPLVTQEACIRTESRGFASRIFGGAVGPMLVEFVRQANLTETDIQQLKQVLNEKNARRRSKP